MLKIHVLSNYGENDNFEITLTKNQALFIKEAVDTLLLELVEQKEKYKGFNHISKGIELNTKVAKEVLSLLEQIPL